MLELALIIINRSEPQSLVLSEVAQCSFKVALREQSRVPFDMGIIGWCKDNIANSSLINLANSEGTRQASAG